MQCVFMCQGILKTQIKSTSRVEIIFGHLLSIIKKKKIKFSTVHTSSKKITHTKMYRAQKLINQNFNQVEYLI